MTNASASSTSPSSGRVFWICALLFLASVINYMDRQTLNNSSQRITQRFNLTDEQYGRLEWAFGWAFAAGATVFGLIADRVNLRWLYPAILFAWSTVGFLTGLVESYAGLFTCRLLLGFFEAGHWPCALKTTERLIPPAQRTFGNSVMQSGTAIGAIVTPQIMRAMLTDDPESWRLPFMVIGGIGIAWVFGWIASIGPSDLQPAAAASDISGPSPASSEDESAFWRRFLTLVCVVIAINIAWHQSRVWLPKFLQNGRGYTEAEMLNVVTLFNIFTDVGCIGGGFLTLRLAAGGFSVSTARWCVFGLGSLMATALLAVPWLGRGLPLEAALYVAGAGLLALFPCYYAYAQEVSARNVGRVSGLLATTAWITTSPLHSLFGSHVDATKSYDTVIACAGLPPLLATLTLALCWKPRSAA